jgi:hypothetical protein
MRTKEEPSPPGEGSDRVRGLRVGAGSVSAQAPTRGPSSGRGTARPRRPAVCCDHALSVGRPRSHADTRTPSASAVCPGSGYRCLRLMTSPLRTESPRVSIRGRRWLGAKGHDLMGHRDSIRRPRHGCPPGSDVPGQQRGGVGYPIRSVSLDDDPRSDSPAKPIRRLRRVQAPRPPIQSREICCRAVVSLMPSS